MLIIDVDVLIEKMASLGITHERVAGDGNSFL